MYKFYILWGLLFFATACASPNSKLSNVQQNRLTSSSQATSVQWTHYAGNEKSTKFSPANLINQSNVKNLKVAWQWESLDEPILRDTGLVTLYNESTPLMVEGRLYLITSLNQIVSLDAKTGELLWVFDPKVYQSGYPTGLGFVQRGVAYAQGRVYATTNDGNLYSIDSLTGKLDEQFAQKGSLDLKKGLSQPVDPKINFSQTSPPLVCGKVLVVGNAINDFNSPWTNPRGDVRAYDLQTGKLKWTFQTVARNSQVGKVTWKNEAWKTVGNTNVWAPMSADLEANLVYLPVSTPSNDFYGGERKGHGLYGDSLVSVDCETGLKKWHYQLIHHSLWDYDPPAAPILFDVNMNNRKVKMVAQVTKQGFVYIFERLTGKPVWPILEKPVPQTDVPGEETALTQPFPTKPLAYDRQGVREEDLIDFTPELRSEALEIIKKWRYGSLYTPPSIQGTISLPGLVGGASWAGAAFNPLTGYLYVPSVTQPNVTVLNKTKEGTPTAYVRDIMRTRIEGPQGLPLFKPPYGRITAIDMTTGDHVWMKPVGKGPKNHPALKHIPLPKEDLGWPRRIHVLATPDLIFAAQDGKSQVIGMQNSMMTLIYKAENDEPFLRAFDAKTGELRAEIPLPGNAFGAPMTYVEQGKQFILLPYGGAGLKSGLMALSL